MRPRRTGEIRQEHGRFRALIEPALGPRVRIRPDPREAEGWPHVPCRYGDLHWRGREWRTGAARIYACTDRPRLIARLLAIPGVHRGQTGDTEAIRAVASLLQARTRRGSSTGRSPEAMALMRATSRPVEATNPPAEGGA